MSRNHGQVALGNLASFYRLILSQNTDTQNETSTTKDIKNIFPSIKTYFFLFLLTMVTISCILFIAFSYITTKDLFSNYFHSEMGNSFSTKKSTK